MEDYPRNLAEFERRFRTEEVCRDYLVQLRWPDGFRCPRWVRQVLASAGRPAAVCRLRLSEFGHRRNDFPGHACTAHALVSSNLVHHESEERNERPGSATDFRAGQLPDGLGVAAQIAPRYGSTGARSAARPRGSG